MNLLMPTMKEIAQLAGVSRGTVDRVLNNRGSVNPDTEKKIRDIVKALDYSPNFAGKTLAVRKKKLKFGYILFGTVDSNSFFEEVVFGIKSRAAELSEFGVTVEMRDVNINEPEQQAKCIDELIELGVNGLAITPINHPIVADKLRKLSESGIPIVTSNSDIPDCGRLAYVGSNYYKSGETAAGLMNLITGGKANIGIIIGTPQVLCHSERVAGFTAYAKKYFSGLKIIDKSVNNDDDIQSFSVTRDMLRNHPEIDALFLAAAGVNGACRAVSDLGLSEKLSIVSYDATASTCQLIREGIISATIAQQPIIQGAMPLDILLDYLCMGTKPEKELNYTEIEIKIKESL